MRMFCIAVNSVEIVRRGFRRGLWPAAVAVVLATAWCGPASGQTTWTGGGADGNWGTSGNWSTTLASPFNTALVFSGSTRTTSTNTIAGGTATSITFNSGASPFTLSGSAITLTGSIANMSSGTQTLNLGLILSTGTVQVTGSNNPWS